MSGTDGSAAWQRALTAAAVLAVNPAGVGGIDLRACVGPVRDAWLSTLHDIAGDRPVRKMPASIDDSRLLGGLDLAATLAENRPVAAQGLLADAHEGIVLVAMAERLSASTSAHLCAALDRGGITAERDGLTIAAPARIGLVTLDEGDGDDERTPSALRDRLAIAFDLRAIGLRDIGTNRRETSSAYGLDASSRCENAELRAKVERAKTRVARIDIDASVLNAFCHAAVALGIDSLRAPLFAARVARIIAALEGRDSVSEDDAREAAALVLAPRATQMPAPSEEGEPDDPPETPAAPPNAPEDMQALEHTQALDDVVLEAAQAALPADLLAHLSTKESGARHAGSRGKAGASQSGQQGRHIGSRAGFPRGGARLDILATLRAAAPWQKLRTTHTTQARIIVRPDDFRLKRFEDRACTTTIFLVDASGSAARERLAEAKGAVRLMLADCYIRRDEVALMAFRGTSVDLLLPPTRSLVRAERALAALPGGGGTPLATALDAAVLLAGGEARKNRTPTLILMSDGRANVARDGAGGRPKAHDDALNAARNWRAAGFASAFIDTSATPSPLAAAIANAMGARYVPLPFADALGVEKAVRAMGVVSNGASRR